LEFSMLVLTQKEGEILQVGDDITIFIKRIRGHWVRLCIDAPPDVELQRIPAPPAAKEDIGSEEEPVVFRSRQRLPR